MFILLIGDLFMIFKCKVNNNTVGVLLDGMLYAIEGFCYKQHVTNYPVVNVSRKGLADKIREFKS